MTSILVVQEDPLVGRIIGRLLEDEGYRIIHVDHLRELSTSCRQYRPKLVVLETLLTGPHDEEIVRRFREEFPETKVLVMTNGVVDPSHATLLAELGVNRWLRAPVHPRVLLVVVHELVGPPSAAA